MDIQTTETPDALARFRNLPVEPKPKMTAASIAKLRAINEHGRRNVEADTRLVKEFNSQTWTLEQLTDLFADHFGGAGFNPRRRAVKALYRLLQGHRVYTIADVSFLGELLPGEDVMPMYKFLARYPLPADEIVTPKGEETESKPVKVRRCVLGQKCLHLKRRQAGEIIGSGKYCSKGCRGRAVFLANRTKGAVLASGTRINIEDKVAVQLETAI